MEASAAKFGSIVRRLFDVVISKQPWGEIQYHGQANATAEKRPDHTGQTLVQTYFKGGLFLGLVESHFSRHVKGSSGTERLIDGTGLGWDIIDSRSVLMLMLGSTPHTVLQFSQSVSEDPDARTRS